MKKVLNLIVLICFLAGVSALHSCKKDPVLPTLTTTAVTAITTNSASSGGNITASGGAEVTARGVCWGTTANPTVSGSKTSDGTDIGTFISAIAGLTPNTDYHVRAYATNSVGTAYGNDVPFKTLAIVGATVTTSTPTFTATTATAGGNVTLDGGAAVTERGVCWSTTANPNTTTGTKVVAAAAGLGAFTVPITGLQPGTTYHVVAYAINSSGTSYGSDVAFATLATKPTVTSATDANPTQTTATVGGEVTATGGAAITERGVYWGLLADPSTTGTKAVATLGQLGTFTVSLTNLTPATKYYVKAFATNSQGTEFGTEVSFTTDAVTIPILTTTAPAFVAGSSTSVTAGGNVTSAGGGTVTERGVCYSLTAAPDINDPKIPATQGGIGTFTVTLPNLTEGTNYYVRAYAVNGAGPAYGAEFQILTMMSDRQNNIYKTVRIGTQIWMAENLKVTQLTGGTAIENVESATTWPGLTTAAYCWYNNNEVTNKPLYGALYNWFAVNTGTLCPTGWKVPSDIDFKTLETSLGMLPAQVDALNVWRGTNQGAQLKSSTGWTAGAGTNTSGFTALPGGYRFFDDGGFAGAGTIAYFWTLTPDGERAYMRLLDSTHDGVWKSNADTNAGKSVRCVKE
jgi:uncharacterized protein (TIGR02145 family)